MKSIKIKIERVGMNVILKAEVSLISWTAARGL